MDTHEQHIQTRLKAVHINGQQYSCRIMLLKYPPERRRQSSGRLRIFEDPDHQRYSSDFTARWSPIFMLVKYRRIQNGENMYAASFFSSNREAVTVTRRNWRTSRPLTAHTIPPVLLLHTAVFRISKRCRDDLRPASKRNPRDVVTTQFEFW